MLNIIYMCAVGVFAVACTCGGGAWAGDPTPVAATAPDGKLFLITDNGHFDVL